MFSATCGTSMNGLTIAITSAIEGASPMLVHEREQSAQLNWIAILSYTGSVAVSLAIWVGLFLVVGRFVK